MSTSTLYSINICGNGVGDKLIVVHMFCYRPQTKFAKVMFLHLSAILFTGGGVPEQVHPPAGTPPSQVHLPWSMS